MATTMQQARSSVRTASGLDMLAGLWLIVAPFFLEYANIAAANWNSVIFGIAILALAGSRELGQGYRYAWPSWVNMAIGLWLIVAPFVLGFSTAASAMWTHVLTGIVVAFFALWSAMATPHEKESA